MHGIFITFEGVEGSGKTTQIALLSKQLLAERIPHVTTREPGGTRLADALRAILLDPKSSGMPAASELMLYVAARADHIERAIRPALDTGLVVLCDRYLDATLAYQGYGRGLSREWILSLHAKQPLTLRPGLTVLLDMPARQGLERALARNSRNEGRFEAETLAFHKRVERGYHRLASESPRRFRVVDATGKPAEVASRIAAAVMPRIARYREKD